MISQGIAGWIDWLFALSGQAVVAFLFISAVMLAIYALSFLNGWLYMHSAIVRRAWDRMSRGA